MEEVKAESTQDHEERDVMMSGKGEKRRSRETVESLVDAMFEAEIQDEKDAVNYLKELGQDSELLIDKGLRLIIDHKRRLRVSLAEKKKARFTAFWNRIESLTSTDEIRKALSSLGQATEVDRLAFNRRLAKMTDEDLKALQTEDAILDLWEQFEDKDLGEPADD